MTPAERSGLHDRRRGSVDDVNSSTALITGATSGIGKEIALQLTTLKWTVLIGARDSQRGEQAAAEIGCSALPLDVTDAASIAAAAAGAIRLATLPDDGPSGLLFSWDGTLAPW